MTAATPPPPRDGDRKQPGPCQITEPGLCVNDTHDHGTWPPMHPAAPSEPPATDSPTRGACEAVFVTRWGSRNCDREWMHDGPHIRNDGCGRPEYYWYRDGQWFDSAAPSPVGTSEPPADREPLPDDGPDYHAEHFAWVSRQPPAEAQQGDENRSGLRVQAPISPSGSSAHTTRRRAYEQRERVAEAQHPYMLADTPAEFERTVRVAAARHQAEAARLVPAEAQQDDVDRVAAALEAVAIRDLGPDAGFPMEDYARAAIAALAARPSADTETLSVRAEIRQHWVRPRWSDGTPAFTMGSWQCACGVGGANGAQGHAEHVGQAADECIRAAQDER